MKLFTFTEIGETHIGPAAPNGSVPGSEEHYETVVTVVENDYGSGPKLRVEKTTKLFNGGSVVTVNASTDGHPAVIADAFEKFYAKV